MHLDTDWRLKMQIAFPNQVNRLFMPLALRATGLPVTAGTVNFYLVAITGTNAGKWYEDATDSWNAGETVCVEATHLAKGHWYYDVPEVTWTDEVMYLLYANEDGALAVPVDDQIWCNAIERLQKADRVIDTTTTPWQVNYNDVDGNTLLTQTLKNTDGGDITNKNNILGSLEKV